MYKRVRSLNIAKRQRRTHKMVAEHPELMKKRKNRRMRSTDLLGNPFPESAPKLALGPGPKGNGPIPKNPLHAN
jgi:hypothetical protein